MPTDPTLGPTGKTYSEADFRTFLVPFRNKQELALSGHLSEQPAPIPNFRLGTWDTLQGFLLNLILDDSPLFLRGSVLPPIGHIDFGKGFLCRAIIKPTLLQNNQPDGSGLILIEQHGYSAGKPILPMIGRFAICEHQNKYKPTAVPSRGFHDQWCTLCGLDTSYDSSD